MARQISERKNKIPEFASYEEEVEFWDTHDLGEFVDELEPVEIEVVRPLHHSFAVTLTSDEFHRLMAMARQAQTSPFELLGRWVRDGLGRAESASASATRNGTAAE